MSGRRSEAGSGRQLAAMTPGMLLAASVIVLATVLNLVATTYNTSLLRQLHPLEGREYTYIGDDYPAELPLQLPEVGLSLESGAPYYSLRADDEWGSMFPQPKLGFTSFGPNNRTFMVSMYHQLHCLDVIRVGYLVNGTGAAHHIEHCLRYLRQILLCKADTTLEDANEVRTNPDGRVVNGASGVGMVHRCRDWTKVKRHLEEKDEHLLV